MDGKRLILPDNPTLRDFQDYVAEMKKIRGFNVTDKFYECCLLAEETGRAGLLRCAKTPKAVRSAAVQKSAA